MDATICVWNVPPPPSAPYPPYDPANARGELVGHTDAVWDIAVVREGALLISCGADGATKVWDITTVPGTLQLSWGYNGVGGEPLEVPVGATAVEGIRTNLKLVAVAYRDAVVKLFDIESGKETARLSADVNPGRSFGRMAENVLNFGPADGTPAAQINKVISHPTMPILVTGHEDKYIKMFDLSTGAIFVLCFLISHSIYVRRPMYTLYARSPRCRDVPLHRAIRFLPRLWCP